MKKLISLVFLLTLPISIFALSINSVYTQYNDEIDSNLRKTIYSKTESISKAFQNENLTELEKLMTQDFSNKVKRVLPRLVQQLKPIFIMNEITLQNDYYSSVKAIGENKTYTIGAPNEKSFNINGIKINDKSFVQFFITKKKGIQDLIFLQYVNENNDWKLNRIGGGIYSFENMNNFDLLKASKQYDDKKEYLTSTLYALAASKTLRPTSYLQYKNENKSIEKIQKNFKEFISKNPFPKTLTIGNNITLFKFDIRGSQDRLLPMVKYTTKTDLNNQEAIKKEAIEISKEIFSTYPDLNKNFNHILFQAHKEMPIDPNKQYKLYTTILKNGQILK